LPERPEQPRLRLAGSPAPAIINAAGDQIRFRLMGTGGHGDYLLKHLKYIDNERCVARSDINQEHLDRSALTIGTNPPKFRDYRELLSCNAWMP
jgi:hypothetical protein